jgi:hypothetical protein
MVLGPLFRGALSLAALVVPVFVGDFFVAAVEGSF